MTEAHVVVWGITAGWRKLKSWLRKAMKHGLAGLILMCAISAEPKADESASFFSLVICPAEAQPTESYRWACSAKTVTRIEAHSNGQVIECFWTPRKCEVSA